MKKISILIIFIIFSPLLVISQDYNLSISGNSGSASGSVGGIGGSSGEITIPSPFWDRSSGGKSPRSGSSDRDRERGGGRDTPSTPLQDNYDGPASEGWGPNDLISNDIYDEWKGSLDWKNYAAEVEAMSVLKEIDALNSSDYIDFKQLHKVQVKIDNLSPSEISALGHEGKEAIARFEEKLIEVRSLFSQYLIMAQRIRNNSFSEIDKEVMRLPYEEQNGYFKQFLSKEEFDRAKIEYDKYEKAQVVNGACEKIRNQELRKKNDNRKIESEKTDIHLTLQKVKPNLIDNYKVAEMVVKKMSDNQKQITGTFGEEVVPKLELLERVNGAFSKVNKVFDVKGMLVKAFSGDWKEAISDYGKNVKEKLFDSMKNCVNGLGTAYNTAKRVFSFGETYSTLTNDILEGDKNAMQALLRGEDPSKYVYRTERKTINTVNKGLQKQVY